jgi:predicted glycoside hydrolase/deacetylase ChbG (UPF0249 family)
MLAPAAEICARLAHEFGVNAVRLTNFRLFEMIRPFRPKGLALVPFVPNARAVLERSQVFYNTSALEIPPGDPQSAPHQACRTIGRLNEGVHELICHPGYEDSGLKARDTYVRGRLSELIVLTHAKLGEFLRAAKIERMTFQEYSNSIPKDVSLAPGKTGKPWQSVIWHS